MGAVWYVVLLMMYVTTADGVIGWTRVGINCSIDLCLRSTAEYTLC